MFRSGLCFIFHWPEIGHSILHFISREAEKNVMRPISTTVVVFWFYAYKDATTTTDNANNNNYIIIIIILAL